MQELRCSKCNKLLGKYSECKQLEIKCPRCGLSNLLVNNLICSEEKQRIRLIDAKSERSCV